MPVVNTNIIKEWFRTLKKPTEDQFHAWLDSFRHRYEKVPLDDVEGLTAGLQKKADLVDGVIPENQLPFSVKSSEIISLGDVTVTGGTVNMAVHSSGVNKVRVNGAIVQRTFPNAFAFTPLSFGSVKVLRGYAINNAAPFYMVEGEELDEYEEPEIPEGALEIFKITLNPFGSSVDETVVGFREKVIDNWNGVYVHSGNTALIISNYGLRYSLFGNTGVRIGGFYNYRTEPLYNGIPLSIKNDTGDDIEFFNLADASPNFIPINPADLPFSIKDGETANFAWHTENGFEIVKTGSTPDLSGYATTADLDTEEVNRAMADAAIQSQVTSNTMTRSSVTDKMVHYWDQSVMRWISTGVEFLGNAVLKLKIIAFGGYTIAQKNAIASPVEGMLIYQNESPKGFQKYEAGAWSALGGNNISNADLSNVSARTFLQAADFTWNTAGFKYYLKNLVDKTGDSTYNKKIVLNSSGEVAIKDDSEIVVSYTHTGNQEIYFSSIDYVTGIAVCTANHGLSVKTKIGIFANGTQNFLSAKVPDSNMLSIPMEYQNNDMYVTPVAGQPNQLKFTNNVDAIVAVNVSSIANIGNLNINLWHIEVFTTAPQIDLPVGYTNIDIHTVGFCTGNRARQIRYNGYSTTGILDSSDSIINSYLPLNITATTAHNNVFFKTKTSVLLQSKYISSVQTDGISLRSPGTTTLSYGSAMTSQQYVYFGRASFDATLFVGIARIGFVNGLHPFANGTLIEIHKK